MKGRTRCRLHGGAPGSGRPPIHGRFSRYASDLGPGFIKFLRDPEILSSLNELALFDYRGHQLIEQMPPGVPHAEELQSVVGKLRNALFVERDPAQVKLLFDDLAALVDLSRAQAAMWDQLLHLAETRSKLALAAERNVIAKDQVWTEQKAMVFLAMWMQAVAAETDAATVARVQIRVAREHGKVVELPAGD